MEQRKTEARQAIPEFTCEDFQSPKRKNAAHEIAVPLTTSVLNLARSDLLHVLLHTSLCLRSRSS